jgi:hypothetical protein
VRSLRAKAGLLALCAGAVGCAIPAFACEEDAQCAATAGGRCEADARCSYPDGECPSGRRYGEYAGEQSNVCVDAPSPTSSGADTAETLETSATTAGDSTTSTGSGESTTTTGATTSSGGGESSTTGNIPLAPLGHWPLDDAGPVATDISGNDHHGARDGGEWVEGWIGGAIEFSNEDDGINVGTDPVFHLAEAPGVTLMGWARFDAWTISNVPIVAKFGAYNLLFWGATSVPDDLQGIMVVYPAGAVADGDTDGPLNEAGSVSCHGPIMQLSAATGPEDDGGVWHHYAGTYDVASRMIRFYQDGVETCAEDVSVEMLDGTIAESSSGVQIGRWQASGPTLMGAIDDVRIYDSVLSAEDIAVIAAQRR